MCEKRGAIQRVARVSPCELNASSSAAGTTPASIAYYSTFYNALIRSTSKSVIRWTINLEVVGSNLAHEIFFMFCDIMGPLSRVLMLVIVRKGFPLAYT